MAQSRSTLLGERKNKAAKKIWQYQKRRNEVKKQLGRGNSNYNERVKVLKTGILRYRKRIKVIDDQVAKMQIIDEGVEDFVGISPREKGKKNNNEIARKLFYTWGLENGVRSTYLVDYIESTYRKGPTIIRMRFKRSFKDKPENKQLWRNFSERMKETSNQLG